jgi:hypothetical protein
MENQLVPVARLNQILFGFPTQFRYLKQFRPSKVVESRQAIGLYGVKDQWCFRLVQVQAQSPQFALFALQYDLSRANRLSQFQDVIHHVVNLNNDSLSPQLSLVSR